MNDFEGVFIQLLTKNTSTNYKRKQKALTTTAEAAVYIVTETVSMWLCAVVAAYTLDSIAFVSE